MWPAIAWAVAAVVGGFLLARSAKAPKTKPPLLDESNAPGATEGWLFPVFYGTVWQFDPNFVAWWDPGVQTDTRDHIKYRTYSVKWHLECSHGPNDALLEVRFDDKTALQGTYTESQTISINQPGLFGGSDREGGIVAELDLMMGEPPQAQNARIVAKYGSLMPAFRGIAGLVFDGAYAINNPIPKIPSTRWVRLREGWRDGECWYPERVEVGGYSDLTRIIAYVPASGDYLQSPEDYPATYITPVYGLWAGTIQRPGAGFDSYISATYAQTGYARSFKIDHGSPPVLNVTESSLQIDHADHLAQFFPGREGYIKVVFSTPQLGTVVGTSAYLIGCGRAGGAVPDGSYSWALRYSQVTQTLGWVHFTAAEVEVADWGDTVLVADTVYTVEVLISPTQVRVLLDGVEEIAISDSAEFLNPSTEGSPAVIQLGHLNSYVGSGGAFPEWGIEDDQFVFGGVLNDIVVATGEPQLLGDMNPAHMVYDARTNAYRGVGYPVAMIDDATMRAAADVYFGEGFGLSGKWNRQDSTSEWIRVINETTDSVERISPTTGKYSIKPLRGDYDPDAVPVFDEANIISVDDFAAKGYGDLVSRITVRYTHPDTGKQATTPAWNNPATLRAQGRRVEDTVDYPLIRQPDLAMRVCARDGIKRSHELRAWTMTVNREGYGLQKGDVISVTWPKLGMAGVIVRILAVNYGSLRNREIRLGVVEDVYGLPISSYTTVESSLWSAPSYDANPVTVQTAMELPYWHVLRALGVSDTGALDADAGFARALGVQPSGVATGYDLWRQVNAAGYLEEITDEVWAITDTLADAISGSATVIPVTGVGLANIEVGDLLQIGEGATAEIVRCTAEYASGEITVARGHLDTTPAAHASGARIWYLSDPGFLQDDTEYTAADEVDYKLLTRTLQDVVAIGSATAASVTLDSRQVRPIAPGNVTINTEAWPTLLDGALAVAWAHRDRLSHDDTTTQAATGITTEAGVTYNAYAYLDDDDTLLDSDTGISGTTWSPTISTSGTIRIEIEAERDGYVSWQRQVRIFEYTTTDTMLDAGGDFLLDAAGDYLLEA